VPWCYPQMLRRGWERRVAGRWHVMHRVAGAAGTSLRPTLDPPQAVVCVPRGMDMGDMEMDMDMDMDMDGHGGYGHGHGHGHGG
jgi:hypothetical protein